MDNGKLGIGVNLYSQPHYLDHLAVVCIILGVPLLILEESIEQLARHCYPGLKILSLDFHEFNPEYLIANFDYIVSSDLWDRRVMRQKFAALEAQYGKTLRCVHCPHGFSDKAFYLRKSAEEDILMVYGEHMLDMLRREGVYDHLNQYVISGNYRCTYYQQNQASLDKIIADEVLSHFDAKRPTILYAPSWIDLERSSSYFEAAETLFDHLPDDYNMIVKLHPRLELDDTANYYRLLGKYEGRKNLVFIKDLPLIYPLLASSDIYVGDVSAIGYDYLWFNRPMFFLNPRGITQTIFQCGTVLSPEEFSKLYDRMKQVLPEDAQRYKQIREETYLYTFGKARSFEDIRSEILERVEVG